jgi:hypothetical protein
MRPGIRFVVGQERETMPAFRYVESDQAGPDALGILVPPGRRTLVILRPRRLDCDLLVLDPTRASPSGAAFWDVGPQEAIDMAQQLRHALEEGAACGAIRVEAVASATGEGYRVLAAVAPFTLIACLRRAGQAYQPLSVATVAEAQRQAERIAALLCPTGAQRPELYFNTKNFARR